MMTNVLIGLIVIFVIATGIAIAKKK